MKVCKVKLRWLIIKSWDENVKKEPKHTAFSGIFTIRLLRIFPFRQVRIRLVLLPHQETRRFLNLQGISALNSTYTSFSDKCSLLYDKAKDILSDDVTYLRLDKPDDIVKRVTLGALKWQQWTLSAVFTSDLNRITYFLTVLIFTKDYLY